MKRGGSPACVRGHAAGAVSPNSVEVRGRVLGGAEHFSLGLLRVLAGALGFPRGRIGAPSLRGHTSRPVVQDLGFQHHVASRCFALLPCVIPLRLGRFADIAFP